MLLNKDTKPKLSKIWTDAPLETEVLKHRDGICTPSHQPDECGRKAFFKVVPGTGPEPTRAWHFQ